MTKQTQSESMVPAGMEEMSAVAKQSFDAMAGTFSEWLRGANRFQAEAIRFLNQRFQKDIEMMSQFATCKKPEQIFELQARLASTMVSDYMAEGTRLLELFGDAAKGEVEEFSKAFGVKH